MYLILSGVFREAGNNPLMRKIKLKKNFLPDTMCASNWPISALLRSVWLA